MFKRAKNLIVLLIITWMLYSCTMANSNSIRGSGNSNVDFNTMSIGDTLIFSPEYIATYRFKFNENENENGRKVIFRNHDLLAKVVASGRGKIFVNTCINQAGEPVFVSIDQEKSTIEDKETLANALNMIARYRFEKDTTGYKYECGMIKLFLDINAFR